jgi:CO/xanthine dehydrogenase Mo-binding subunit
VHLAHPSLRKTVMRALPDEKVRYVGEPVAVVVAETRYQPRTPASSSRSDYERPAGAGHLRVAMELRGADPRGHRRQRRRARHPEHR